MRKEFGKLITELAAADEKIVLIVGDIGYAIFDDFRARFPEKFFNVGVCEQSMVSMAAGMALEGLKPWVYTITPFLVERPFEQVKLDVDQQKANVKLVGYADYPHQGPTHAEILTPEIMADLFFNMNCWLPKDDAEVKRIVHLEALRFGPAFISLKKSKG